MRAGATESARKSAKEALLRTFAVAIAIVTVALALPPFGARADESAGRGASIPAPPLPGVGARDPRVRVDPETIPWRAVGKLQAASMNFRTLCTATLVGLSTVVTAAHCLFNRRTQRNFPPQSLHFLIGFRAGGYAGHAVGARVETASGYDPHRPQQSIGKDWALVFLDKPLGSPDRILPILAQAPEIGARVMLGGYQQDHPLVLMADVRCRIDGRLVDAGGQLLLRHNCAATGGASGGPLLIRRDGRWYIAAIDVAGGIDSAGGAAVALGKILRDL
jgi:protease YdgD